MLRFVVFTLAVALGISLASAQVKLELRFHAREKFETSIDAKIKQKLTIGEADIDAAFEEHLLVESLVGERGGDGRLPIVERFTAWQTELQAADQQARFDLANPEVRASSNIDHFLDPQRVLAKTPRTIVLDDADRVIALDGYDNLRNGLSDISKKQNETLLDAQYYRNAWEAHLDRLPAGEIREGDVWERTHDFAFYGNQSLQITRKYTYAGPIDENGRRLERVDTTVTKAVYALGAGGEIEIIAAPTDLTIESSTGHWLFDRERGCVVRCQEQLHVHGGIPLQIGPQRSEVKSIVDLTLETAATRLP